METKQEALKAGDRLSNDGKAELMRLRKEAKQRRITLLDYCVE
jgi:hypothetical protein